MMPFAARPLETSRIEEDGTLTLQFSCPFCRQPSEVSGIDRPTWEAWRRGLTAGIAEVFPALTAGEREILKTGIHPACWDLAFSEEGLEELQDDDARLPYEPE